jgi:hypothetical protein
MRTKSDLIDANQLKDILALTSSTTEEYAKALRETMEIALEQPLVAYTDPSELLVKDSGYPPDTTIITSGTIHADFSNMPSQTIIALQCRSCGGIIDKDTMTCKHCGMTYMLVDRSEISPRYSDF